MVTTSTIQGPAWDIASEYPSTTATPLAQDLAESRRLKEQVLGLARQLEPFVAKATSLAGTALQEAVRLAQEASALNETASILLGNVECYLNCVLSVDGRHNEAKALLSKKQGLEAELGQAYYPVVELLKMASDDFIAAYLSSPQTAAQNFAVERLRLKRDERLSLAEETLILALDVNGPQAWGNLYDNLAGSISVDVHLPEGPRAMGLAEAQAQLQDQRVGVRKAAYHGIAKAWTAHEEPAAAILNALAGWRLDLAQRRSHTKPVHFLDSPLHSSRIQRETLEAMLSAVREAAPLARQVPGIQAKMLGHTKLGPWDLFAPCPPREGGTWEHTPFDRAIDLIAASFSKVHPDMGAFVRMMAERRWIEGTRGPTKRPGAYCTQFLKSRTPRVYMTYTGGMREFKTLAHELGHAFHDWVMRDMSLAEISVPMTLAETASIFAETVVNNALIESATTPADRLALTWAQAREVEAFLLNIPARFEFERSFFEKRRTQTLPPEELRDLMKASWSEWYGDALSEMDGMFWASKLHFSIPGLSFYNFPYTFGYLFALGVYAQRQRLGDDFYPAYVALLRDTGRMTAEALAKKHLGADLTRPEFWRQSIATAGASVAAFAAAAGVEV